MPPTSTSVFAIEALANPRMRDELGELQLVPPEERVSGPGATPVMAAFTHLNPEGSRFSDGSYGVYYAAHSLATAMAEVSHHRAVFLRRTDEPAIDSTCASSPPTSRPSCTTCATPARRSRRERPLCVGARPGRLRPVAGASAGAARAGQLGHPLSERARCRRRVRRRSSGRARCATPSRRLHIALHWDGERITHWYEKRAPHPLRRGESGCRAPGGRRDCLQMRQLLATVPVRGATLARCSSREKFVNR